MMLQVVANWPAASNAPQDLLLLVAGRDPSASMRHAPHDLPSLVASHYASASMRLLPSAAGRPSRHLTSAIFPSHSSRCVRFFASFVPSNQPALQMLSFPALQPPPLIYGSRWACSFHGYEAPSLSPSNQTALQSLPALRLPPSISVLKWLRSCHGCEPVSE